MKTEQPILITTLKTTTDVLKNRIIGYGGTYHSGFDMGVVNADTLSGESAPVMLQGIALVTSGEQIAQLGTGVKSDADGKAVICGNDRARVGIALDTCSGADELIRVLVTPSEFSHSL